jgi:hypothetical protein
MELKFYPFATLHCKEVGQSNIALLLFLGFPSSLLFLSILNNILYVISLFAKCAVNTALPRIKNHNL